jgi:tetratricopeptide (TPR) repeat protein
VTRILHRPLAIGLAAALALGGCGGAPPASGPADLGVAAVPPTPTDEPSLRAALAADPYDAACLSRLSKILWDEGRYEEGATLLEEARAASPAFPEELLAALALHHDALGHADVASSLEASLEGRLRDWSRGGSAVTFLRLRGDSFADCEEVARRALEARPSAANHNNLGIALLYAGRPEEARQAFLAAHDADRGLPGPLYNLAIVDRFYRFDEKGAREWFGRYRTLAADDPDGLAELLAEKVKVAASGDSAGGTTEVSR